jgi:hypothetical protein
MIINPRNVKVSNNAREFLRRKILPGDVSNLDQMRILSILVYTLSVRYTDTDGNAVCVDEPQYLIYGIEPYQLKDELIIEVSEHKPLAIRLDTIFSEESSYYVDISDGRISISCGIQHKPDER